MNCKQPNVHKNPISYYRTQTMMSIIDYIDLISVFQLGLLHRICVCLFFSFSLPLLPCLQYVLCVRVYIDISCTLLHAWTLRSSGLSSLPFLSYTMYMMFDCTIQLVSFYLPFMSSFCIVFLSFTQTLMEHTT